MNECQSKPPADSTWSLSFDSYTSPLIRAVPALGFPAHYGHTVGGHIRSLTQAQSSLTIVKLFSIRIAKLVPVVLPEATGFILLFSLLPFPKPILHLCVILLQAVFYHLH